MHDRVRDDPPGAAADQEALGRLGALLVTNIMSSIRKRFLAPRPDMPQAYGHFLASQIGSRIKLVLVAEAAGAVVGYAFAGMEGFDYMALRGPAGVIYDLVVDPGHRRQGIGAALMDAAFAELGEARGAARAAVHGREEPRRPVGFRARGLSPDDDRDDARAELALFSGARGARREERHQVPFGVDADQQQRHQRRRHRARAPAAAGKDHGGGRANPT